MIIMEIRKIYKDANKRHTFNFFEKKKYICNFLLTRCDNYNEPRYRITNIVKQIPTANSITRIRNRCVITGRSRGILSKHKVSRHMFKSLVNTGQITGYRKL
jgi:small subunit ribosomal protein S14